MSEITVSLRNKQLLQAAIQGIERYLQDIRIVEIMINPDQSLWIERIGEEPTRVESPLTTGQVVQIIHLIASHTGEEIHSNAPSLSAKLPAYGVRVQAFLPPIVAGPTLIFRKHAPQLYPLEEYRTLGMIKESWCHLLTNAVRSRENILVAGGTGSGKTTFVNALLQVVAEQNERVYLVEDNPELKCYSENRLEILIKPPVYDYRRAIFDALRSRPDRIILGEVRDGAALELLKAWNTGHPGGIATIHANSARAALNRMCQLIEEVVPTAPKELISEAVQLVVFLKKDPQHPSGRRVVEVVKLLGLTDKGAWDIQEV